MAIDEISSNEDDNASVQAWGKLLAPHKCDNICKKWEGQERNVQSFELKQNVAIDETVLNTLISSNGDNNVSVQASSKILQMW